MLLCRNDFGGAFFPPSFSRRASGGYLGDVGVSVGVGVVSLTLDLSEMSSSSSSPDHGNSSYSSIQ